MNILLLFLTLNAIVVAIFVISDNRSPSSTIAWILALTFFPVIGLLFYIFAGRTSKAFSRQRKLTR